MSTIYERSGGSNREGDAYFHTGNPDLPPEWLIKAVRESKEAAMAMDVIAREVNEQDGGKVFTTTQTEKLITADENYRAVIKASSELLMSYRAEATKADEPVEIIDSEMAA